jgi:hypothetical protein
MGAHAGGTIGIVSRRFRRNNAQQQGEHFSDSLLPFESMRSAVYVMGSAALASREIATAASDRGRMCLKRVNVSHNATIVAEGAKVREPLLSQIEVSALPSSMRGVQVYAWRTMADAAIEAPSRSPYYEDSFAFAMGPAVITLDATGSPHPFPGATERRLISLLYRRAKSHKL